MLYYLANFSICNLSARRQADKLPWEFKINKCILMVVE